MEEFLESDVAATMFAGQPRRVLAMTHASSATAEGVTLEHEARDGRHSCRKGKYRWSGLEIVAVIAGFVVFWPLGLLALALKLIRGEIWAGASQSVPPWVAFKTWKQQNRPEGFGFASNTWQKPWQAQASSGNAAFDAYRKEQLDRLEAERRKLEEEQKAFAEHLAKLRRAKDQEEFDRFMAERRDAASGNTAAG